MTMDRELTNGRQVQGTRVAPLITSGHLVDLYFESVGGSCNAAPIGAIPSVDNIPSSKFIYPPNFGLITGGQNFTVRVAVRNFQAGNFTNPDSTYMSGPNEVNADGNIIGHSHIVVERLIALNQTSPMDPKAFELFVNLNEGAVDGVLSFDVIGGLPVGVYRIATFHTGSNHQPSAYTSRLVL
jgi:hypothetical protein